MGELRVQRLEPVHDPEACDRVMRILSAGLRRGLLRRRNDAPQESAPPFRGDAESRT